MNQERLPLLTVVVPVYGVESYIEQCARSLLEQTYQNIEYIFINDCTQDSSIQILNAVVEEYPNRKSNIRIISNSENKGLAYSRRIGYLSSNGDYVTSCDGDDWVAKDMYRIMLEKAMSEDSDIVLIDMVSHNGVKPIGNILCKFRNVNYLIEDTLLGDVSACIPACLFKRNLISDDIIFPEADMAEDLVLSIQLILKSQRISYCENALYYYRYNNHSISRTKNLNIIIRNTKQYRENVFRVIRILDENNLTDRLKEEIIYLKHRAKSYIWPYVYDKSAYVMWRNTFPELITEVMHHKRIKYKTKLLYILTQLGLYPLFKRLLLKN